MRRIVLVLLSLLFALSGCQRTPAQAVVASKNDGTFEAALHSAVSPTLAPAPAAEAAAAPTAAPVVHTDSFMNAAGDISIDMALTEPAAGPMPVLQARPLEFTGQQAESIARALFGDGPIYEYTQEMTKAQIEQAILADRQFISDWDGMLAYYGGDEAMAQAVKEDFEGRIAALEAAWEAASDDVEPAPCAWEFHSQDYYQSPEMAASFQDEGHRYIMASATLDGIPWTFSVCNREGTDYRIHNIAAFPDERTADQEQTASGGPGMDAGAMKAWALATAEKMDMGSWALVSDEAAEAVGFGGGEDWYKVILTRTYEGAQAAPFSDAPAADEQYAPSYGGENMLFEFYKGHFAAFWYSSATQAVSTVNAGVPLLPFADVLDRAKEQMKMVTMDNILYGGDDVRIAADTVELGLVSTPMKDNATDFYLVPAYIFYGTAAAHEPDGSVSMIQWMDNTGSVAGEEPAESKVLLAVINAVDGTAMAARMGD